MSRPRPGWRQRRRPAVAAAALALLSLLTVWGVSGYLRVRVLQREIEAVERDLATLRLRATALTETIDRLRNDPAYVEKLAREEHGLVREGETVLKFPSRRP